MGMSATDIIVTVELILSIVVVAASISALTVVFKSPHEKSIIKENSKMGFGRLKRGAAGAGYVILQIALFLFSIFPIAMLGVPWWARLLIITADYFIGSMFLGIPELALWIVALVITINGKQDGFAIAYYICFGLYALEFVVSLIIALVQTLLLLRERQ